jgi:hypothetical protein
VNIYSVVVVMNAMCVVHLELSIGAAPCLARCCCLSLFVGLESLEDATGICQSVRGMDCDIVGGAARRVRGPLEAVLCSGNLSSFVELFAVGADHQSNARLVWRCRCGAL